MKTFTRLLAAMLLAMAIAGFARLVSAQDEPAPPSQPPSQTDERDADARAPADEDDDVFIPTEEIPADEEITFPVNI